MTPVSKDEAAAYGSVAFPHLHVAMRALAFMVTQASVTNRPTPFDEERLAAVEAIHSALEHPISRLSPDSPARDEDAAIAELRNIAKAKRFDRDKFDDDASFADWAQSRARHALAAIDAARKK